jgi:cytochrome b involved in lipid metabolism
VAVIFGFLIFNKKELRPIALDEISTHNSKDSCWTAINGGVYDVTKFISSHKGGDKILNACGVDATDFFTGKHPTIGRVHSEMATKLLGRMKIGELIK